MFISYGVVWSWKERVVTHYFSKKRMLHYLLSGLGVSDLILISIESPELPFSAHHQPMHYLLKSQRTSLQLPFIASSSGDSISESGLLCSREEAARAMLKRVREDGHLSKEEYTVMSSQDTRSVFNLSSVSACTASSHTFPPSSLLFISFSQEGFARATPNTLAARRMVVAQRPAKKEEFAKHIKALNALFYDWLQREITGNPCCDLTDGFQVRTFRSRMGLNAAYSRLVLAPPGLRGPRDVSGGSLSTHVRRVSDFWLWRLRAACAWHRARRRSDGQVP
jgi:hypothetical protein